MNSPATCGTSNRLLLPPCLQDCPRLGSLPDHTYGSGWSPGTAKVCCSQPCVGLNQWDTAYRTYSSQLPVVLNWKATTYGAYSVFTLDTVFLARNVCSFVLCWNHCLHFLLPVHTQEGLLRCLETRAYKNARMHVTILILAVNSNRFRILCSYTLFL